MTDDVWSTYLEGGSGGGSFLLRHRGSGSLLCLLLLLSLQVGHHSLLEGSLDVLLALAQSLLRDSELGAVSGAEGRGLLPDALVVGLHIEADSAALDVQIHLELLGSSGSSSSSLLHRGLDLLGGSDGGGHFSLQGSHHILGTLRQSLLGDSKLGAVIGAKLNRLVTNAGGNGGVDLKLNRAAVNIQVDLVNKRVKRTLKHAGIQ